jgi:hypothetical protein
MNVQFTCPSPPACGGEEGPIAERWEGEVGCTVVSSGSYPHLTPTLSAPGGGEGAVAATFVSRTDAGIAGS